ncbi:hypothetical protein [Nitrosococcus oceani]|uniref:hypothetical protein n=1 Tax=Nitrosococcus oceani TaxID=1229 RepID=UPI00030BA1D8|nr:hypothetical protein [Nitrosococcus oceani]
MHGGTIQDHLLARSQLRGQEILQEREKHGPALSTPKAHGPEQLLEQGPPRVLIWLPSG